MKNVAVFTEDGAFALFFSPHKSPHPREFAIQGKKNANARGGAGRSWNWLMHKCPHKLRSTSLN